MLDLSPGALVVLAGALVYLGGIALWLFAQRYDAQRYAAHEQTRQAETLSQLSQRNRQQFVQQSSEAELREITGQVNAAEPPMPESDRPDIDIHFYNRAN